MVIGEQAETGLGQSQNGGHGDAAISVKDLWKVYGRNPQQALAPENAGLGKRDFQENLGLVVGLQQVSFDVHRGETFVVMGLSGSGKSTLVRCLTRLIEPTVGEIMVDGEDILKADEQRLIEFRRGKVAMVFQNYGLLPHRNVMDNASLGLELRGLGKSERCSKALEILEMVGLDGWEMAYPRELSGGMQQRVGLARALAMDPDILLMDEPFSGLDPLIRRNMQDELIRLEQDLHKTIVFITHDLTEAVKMGDRIAIMRDGAVVQIGEPEDIVLNPEDEYVAEFTQDIRRESILTASHIMEDPPLVIPSYKGPQEALQAMNSDTSDVALVLGNDDTYLGILTKDQALAALQAGVDKLDDHIDRYLHTDLEPISDNVALEQIIPISIMCEYPIPVVDEGRKLIGVVHRNAIADAISANSSSPALPQGSP